MDFENEPLENEDERELESFEDGVADEIVEPASDSVDALDFSLERADEGDATDDSSAAESTTAVDPPETPIAPDSQTIDVERAVEPQVDLSRAKVVSFDAQSGFGNTEAPTASDAGEAVTRITVTDLDRERREGLSDWALGMLQAGPRGEQGIAQAVAYVRLPDDQMEQAKRDALADVAQRDAMVCKDIAQSEVRHEFWVRDCQERAITGNR